MQHLSALPEAESKRDLEMRSPEKTNQMGGACPTLACSHLASLLQMVPLKPSLPTSSARWLASLHAQQRCSAWAVGGRNGLAILKCV